ncbi:MAG: trehalose-6-phosphate synthase [Candidatus Obscuribacterales bacterium]|jgi:trehalose-6-phosphate synthase|nr:trehalose-6-phosphate synthase [Candidatus Obscuribacterales bacterium]
MHLVTYRGPSMAGGVSGAFSSLWQNFAQAQDFNAWTYLVDDEVVEMRKADDTKALLGCIPAEILDGHYRFCNLFIWPVMHDMGQRAHYAASDRTAFRSFNRLIADCLFRKGFRKKFAQEREMQFVQDYQLALLPALAQDYGFNSTLFWHIPWPKEVQTMHVPPLVEIATALLAADTIGFHTQEYAHNFLQFVDKYIPERSVNLRSGKWRSFPAVVARPLGIDNSGWQNAAISGGNFMHPALEHVKGKKIVLSVDRADYTKGVSERMQMISTFAERYPDLSQNVVFVQICTRTRAGLPAFDDYWERLEFREQQLAARKNDLLVWLKDPIDPAQLALLYKRADAMLVTPLRDGLNLTAKEFVLSQAPHAMTLQGKAPAPLLLSPGAGVFNELGRYSIAVDPIDDIDMADSVAYALGMDDREKTNRHHRCVAAMSKHTLTDWWNYFAAINNFRNRDIRPSSVST